MAKFVEGYVSRIKLRAGERDRLVFDDVLPGFFIRVFASGAASYGVKYSVGRQQRRLALGAVVPGTLAEMRKKASDVLARARLGQDVVAAKKAAAGKLATRLGELVPKYLAARKEKLRPRTYLEVARHLERQWKPLHVHAVDAVTRAHIGAVLDELETHNGAVAADRAKASLSTFCAWCIDKSYLEVNPTTGIKARSSVKARDRFLTEEEIVDVWNACQDDDHGRITRLLLLTGQRRAEIGDLGWRELNLEFRHQERDRSGRVQEHVLPVIELPPTRSKNHKPHLIPLSPEALALLAGLEQTDERDLIFGSGAGGFSGWSKAKKELDERIAKSRKEAGRPPMKAWRLHDARRSVVTGMSERGFAPPHVIEVLVNHISGHKAGIGGVYNRAVYLMDRWQAMKLWGAYLAALVSSDSGKVVPLTKARAAAARF